MKNLRKGKLSAFSVAVVLLWLFSCVLIGASFYAMSVTVDVPNYQTNNPTDGASVALATLVVSFENVFNFIMPFVTTIIGILVFTLLVSIAITGLVLCFWRKDRNKLASWLNTGFACEQLEFLQGNRIMLNKTEILLNKSQYLTMQKLMISRIEGEALHAIEIGENATQTVKRLREELGSKLIEKTLIMNHRGQGYWIDIDPECVKGVSPTK